MPNQGRNLNTPSPNPPLAPLAAMSAYGGIESVAITSVVCAGVITLCFGSNLVPALGGLGAALVIAGAASAIERLTRPIVLWALGMHVYSKLTRLGGKQTADEVARLYAADQTINQAQLDRIIQRSAHTAGAADRRTAQ